MARAQRIPHHILPRARSYDFGGVGEAADDGHAGEVGGRGAGEGAGEVVGELEVGGGVGVGEGGAEGCEEGHFCFYCCGGF